MDKLTWMVVEDDHAIRDVLVTMCELWEDDILTFKDGFDAMAYLEQGTVPDPVPDVALIDIRMPGPWGHEVSARIRDHDQLKGIGVVLMTAYALPGQDENTYRQESGADKLVYKPLPPMDDLRQQITDVLAERAKLNKA